MFTIVRLNGHNQLEALLSQSKQDRPEVRAKSSIGLVAFVIAKAAETDDNRDADDLDQQDACIAIVRGLGDKWPLVREAFQEQLAAGFEKSSALRTQIGHDELLDRIIGRVQETIKLASEKLAAATGILALVGITHGNNEQEPLCNNWNDGRVDTILTMAFKGWATKQETPQATRFIELVSKSFSDFQLIRSLGSFTTTLFAQAAQVIYDEIYYSYYTTKAPTSADTASTAMTALHVRDWALAIWVCDMLRIPRGVFATRSHLEESPDNIRIATSFVESAPILLECLGQILRIQTVDNTYTLHRIIMACAAFTNPKDAWNQRYPSVSKAAITRAEQNLTAIVEHTHWSVKNSSSTPTPSLSGASPDDSKNCDPNSIGSHDHHRRTAIMIPGSFSDHAIQILEKEIRPCFANIQAHKVAQRAQATIEMHQDKLRHQKQLVSSVEESSSSKEDGAVSTTGDSTGKDVARRDQGQNRTNATRYKIAPVGDTPNDEDEFWTRMDNRSEEEDNYDPTLPKRWNVDFLESVPIAEWCARQPIEDSSRILEVFMLLMGPILAMAESVDFRYRVRGLDLLSRFLLRYHGSDINTNTGKGVTRAALESQRIWIRIFERTGLDQVLERTLTPLLAPIQAMFSPAPGAEDYHPGTDESGYSLEVLTAAFEAYLTLVLVNTEPADKPNSETDDSTRISLSQQSRITSATALTVENLFLHGILGSFKRSSPSKEYRTVILEWLARLVRPVISLDFLVVQEEEEGSLLSHPIGFQGIFGMGSLTIKYLPTLIPYLCGILDVPLPSSSSDVRLESLTLAWRVSEALYHVMDVAHARIPRHRGQLLATICKCWANSRIFPVDSTSSSSTSVDKTVKTKLEQEQTRLDESLVRTMRRCIEICQPKITTATTDDHSVPSGLEKDLKILKELDPDVFGPLFVS
ncbi:hypothetical protein BGZ95_003848 [Linnemannia exigua]|uniref:Uncharacterized protein n=1 Tax=Linnemannia exigua TaxID=604196 RepID=A0AAD4D3Q9_9FUNG|nr:hypothetical protein BGZ95_003848 [Linnemannia exigua]